MQREHPYIKHERMERFTLCHKSLPVIQIKLQCLLCSMQLRGYLLAPAGKLQHRLQCQGCADQRLLFLVFLICLQSPRNSL